MGQARKKYTQEYKDEAVELVVSPGRQIAEIARNLGINCRSARQRRMKRAHYVPIF
jgi:transposase-like protein